MSEEQKFEAPVEEPQADPVANEDQGEQPDIVGVVAEALAPLAEAIAPLAEALAPLAERIGALEAKIAEHDDAVAEVKANAAERRSSLVAEITANSELGDDDLEALSIDALSALARTVRPASYAGRSAAAPAVNASDWEEYVKPE